MRKDERFDFSWALYEPDSGAGTVRTEITRKTETLMWPETVGYDVAIELTGFIPVRRAGTYLLRFEIGEAVIGSLGIPILWDDQPPSRQPNVQTTG